MKENPILEGEIQRQIILLALPLLLGNMLQQCYNIVDALIIGQFLGVEAFAAVGVAGTLMNLMIFVLNGFCTGVSVIFATLYGMGDSKKFRQEVFTALGFGGVFTLLISGLFFVGMNPLLELIRTPDGLREYVTEYLAVIAGGMIATCFYNLSSGILRSVGDTKAALMVLAAAVTANAVLDYLFVAVMCWGIAGAAYATVLSQMIAMIGCFLYLKKKYHNLICTRQDMGFHRELAEKTICFGFASALQESSLYIGKILVQGAVNGLGTSGIAAYTAASKLEGFANSFGDSGALAMSVLISQNYGAGKEMRVQEGIRKGVRMQLILGIAMSIILFFVAAPGVKLFLGVNQAEAVWQGAGYLKVVSLFYTLCFVGCALVGFFRGIGMIHVPVVGTTINITTRVLFSYLLIRRFGLSGLGLATGIGWIMVVGYQISRFRNLKQGRK